MTGYLVGGNNYFQMLKVLIAQTEHILKILKWHF
jgi:hypothetical protein